MPKSKHSLWRKPKHYLGKILRVMLHRLIIPREFWNKLNLELDANALLHKLGVNSEEIKQFSGEFAELEAALSKRVFSAKLNYLDSFKIESGSAFIIYSIIRKIKPDKIVETGVANGVSSYYILHALLINGRGSLISIDISHEVGSLLTEEEKKNWELIVLSKPSKAKFIKAISQIGKMDIFLHDSDHSFNWQRIEYNSAYIQIRPNGFLMSDDIDSSYAFLDFVEKNKCQAFVLFDKRKMFGIVPKLSTSTS